MSLKELNKSCVLCHAHLFEEDDVVYCPVCGAPHHRECYNSIGHCALEEAHGTENQYDKLLEKNNQTKQNSRSQAPVNDAQNDVYTPGDEIFQNLPPVDFLGGVPADYIIEDGVTAKEARNFVISNTQRYIPKFKQLSKKNKSSWNFMAFFFPCEWLLSRKMYKKGIIVGLFTVIATLVSIPLNNTLLNLGFFDIKNNADIMNFFGSNLANIHWGALLAAFLGSILDFVLRIVVALLGDYWYRCHAIAKIKEIKETSDNIAEDFRKHGGVSLFLFLVGLLAVQYLPSIIALFI
ncbi:MAG: DUF2628 domain-containing protein [Clostridia bacterium]|nr:DUF2628 domain-containing protein [Clostridia bacterium]